MLGPSGQMLLKEEVMQWWLMLVEVMLCAVGASIGAKGFCYSQRKNLFMLNFKYAGWLAGRRGN